MNFTRTLLVLLCSVGLSFSALAQTDTLIDKTFTGSFDDSDAQVVRRKALVEASEKVSEEIIQELIGTDRFNKNKSLIKNKVIKNSSRYIPFSKPSDIKSENGKSTITLAMKVSLKNLKQILQDNGLLHDNENIPIVLPFVIFEDQIAGEQYRWWNKSETSGFASKEARLIESFLRTAFSQSGFHLVAATESNLGEQIPTEFKSNSPSAEDLQFFSQRFNAPIILDGKVIVSRGSDKNKYLAEVKIAAVQVSNGRTIADITRKFEAIGNSYESAVDKKLTEVLENAASDLAVQIAEVWTRGAIGTSVIVLNVQGRQTLKTLEQFKGVVSSQISQVKSIKERHISSDSVTYEIDTNISARELATKLTALTVGTSKLKFESDENNSLTLRWIK